MGWLHSIPTRKDEKDRRSRVDEYKDCAPSICETPSLDGFDYIADLWFKSGMYSFGQNGVEPLTWMHIAAFDQCQKIELAAFETKCIYEMSRSYCGMFHKAKDAGIFPPYHPEGDEGFIRAKQAMIDSQMDTFDKLLAREAKPKRR